MTSGTRLTVVRLVVRVVFVRLLIFVVIIRVLSMAYYMFCATSACGGNLSGVRFMTRFALICWCRQFIIRAAILMLLRYIRELF